MLIETKSDVRTWMDLAQYLYDLGKLVFKNIIQYYAVCDGVSL